MASRNGSVTSGGSASRMESFGPYAARARMATATAVLDSSYKEIAKVDATVRAFSLRAGPTINGYALCEPSRQARLRGEALDWVEKNPYAMIFVESIPAKAADRRGAVAQSLKAQRTEAAEDAASLARPEEAARLARSRREDEAEQKYCWK